MEKEKKKKLVLKVNNRLDILARVCSYVLEQEFYYCDKDSERKPVPNLVESQKSTDQALNFRKKIRGSSGKPHDARIEQHPDKMNIIKIFNLTPNNHHHHIDHDHSINNGDDDRDRSELSALPPKKRYRFDYHDHDQSDDHIKKGQIMSKKSSGTTATTGSKRRRLDDDQDDEKKEKGNNTGDTKRRNNVNNNKVQGFGRQKQKVVVAGPNPAPAMPGALMEKIVKELGEMSELRLLIQKSLYDSDLKRVQNRFSMPISQLESDDFLTDDEKTRLASRRQGDDKHFQGMELDFFEPNLRKSKMMLKKWDYHNSSSYMLTQHWFAAAERNKLRAGDVVQIWFFRSREGNNPCVALVNLSQQNVSSFSSPSFVGCGNGGNAVDDHQRAESEPRSVVTA